MDPLAILDSAPVSISVSSAVRGDDGTIVDFRTDYVNPAAAEPTGIPREEQIGLLACDVLPGFRESALFRDLCRVVETGTPFVREALPFDSDIEGHDVRVSGTFEVEVHKLEDGVISVSRDVSARKQAEAALSRATAEVERRRFADQQIAEINERIIDSLVQVTAALDERDVDRAQRAASETLRQASRIITDLRSPPGRAA
ncbi:MAG: hypothetical protein QOJ07_3817 [Thermoleophilaceae bacterium]|jgi:hypothetical protein|nr:hypothetical protein [Thermoleophilaceae bacterium]